MLFHFQHKGPTGWEPVGSGEAGKGEADGLREAIGDLVSLAGGLEPGMYSAIPARSGGTRWSTFRIEAAAPVFEDEGFAEPGDGE